MGFRPISEEVSGTAVDSCWKALHSFRKYNGGIHLFSSRNRGFTTVMDITFAKVGSRVMYFSYFRAGMSPSFVFIHAAVVRQQPVTVFCTSDLSPSLANAGLLPRLQSLLCLKAMVRHVSNIGPLCATDRVADGDCFGSYIMLCIARGTAAFVLSVWHFYIHGDILKIWALSALNGPHWNTKIFDKCELVYMLKAAPY